MAGAGSDWKEFILATSLLKSGQERRDIFRQKQSPAAAFRCPEFARFDPCVETRSTDTSDMAGVVHAIGELWVDRFRIKLHVAPFRSEEPRNSHVSGLFVFERESTNPVESPSKLGRSQFEM